MSSERQLLARFETISQFDKVIFRPCMHRTALCPDRCGHAKNWAEFKVVSYLAYEKPGAFYHAELFNIPEHLMPLLVVKRLSRVVRKLNGAEFGFEAVSLTMVLSFQNLAQENMVTAKMGSLLGTLRQGKVWALQKNNR